MKKKRRVKGLKGTTPHQIKIEKREAIFSLRIPMKLKLHVDELDDTQRKSMNHRIMRVMAKAAHDSLFREEDFLEGE
ncbi:MAG: hypothetical protein HZB61_10115 [Nitrospirae bacterium]|nr:hypothetical protein [Nitrospirota bacterium]